MKVGVKLTVVFVVLSVIAISLTSIMFFNYTREIIQERLVSQLETVTFLKENQLDYFIQEKIDDLESLARNKEFLNQIENLSNSDYKFDYSNIEKNKNLRKILLNYLNHFGRDFQDLNFIDSKGRIYVSTNIFNEGQIKKEEDYLKRWEEDSFISELNFDEDTHKATLVLAIPVILKNKGEKFYGVLTANLRFEKLESILMATPELGKTGETYLVNRFNFIIVSSKSEETASSLGRKVSSDVIQNCLNGYSGSGIYENYLGMKVIGKYKWVEKRNFCLISEIDLDEAFQPVNKLKHKMIFINVAVVILVILLGLIISKAITKPLLHLKSFAESVGRGNLNKRINLKTKDEIGDLANAFEDMVKELRNSRKKLEQHSEELEVEVKKRTKELNRKIEELEKFRKFSIGRELKMIELKEKIKNLEKMKK